MRPFSRWAMFALLVVLSVPAGAGGPAPSIPTTRDAVEALSGPTAASWFGLRVRPFTVSALIGRPNIDPDEATRSRALGTAPAAIGLISFARGDIDLPGAARPLGDGPRFSRLPGKQITDYEAGVRTALANGSVTLQAGVSYNRFRNLQMTIRQGTRQTTATAGRVKTYGIEGMARWSPADRLSLFATYAWREGRLKNQLRDGRKFRLSPDRSAAVGAVMLMRAGAGRIAFTPSIGWQSAMGIGADMGSSGSGALLSAQLGYALSDSFEIEALAGNLLNQPATRSSRKDSRPLIAGEPQVFGVRARLRFGD